MAFRLLFQILVLGCVCFLSGNNSLYAQGIKQNLGDLSDFEFLHMVYMDRATLEQHARLIPSGNQFEQERDRRDFWEKFEIAENSKNVKGIETISFSGFPVFFRNYNFESGLATFCYPSSITLDDPRLQSQMPFEIFPSQPVSQPIDFNTCSTWQEESHPRFKISDSAPLVLSGGQMFALALSKEVGEQYLEASRSFQLALSGECKLGPHFRLRTTAGGRMPRSCELSRFVITNQLNNDTLVFPVIATPSGSAFSNGDQEPSQFSSNLFSNGSDLPLPSLEAEAANLRRKINRCIAIDRSTHNVVITVLFSLNIQGVVIGTIELVSSDSENADWTSAAYESVRRAILRCQGNGYALPLEHYEKWREIELVVDFGELMSLVSTTSAPSLDTEEVRVVQRRLTELGCYDGLADGVPGRATVDAYFLHAEASGIAFSERDLDGDIWLHNVRRNWSTYCTGASREITSKEVFSGDWEFRIDCPPKVFDRPIEGRASLAWSESILYQGSFSNSTGQTGELVGIDHNDVFVLVAKVEGYPDNEIVFPVDTLDANHLLGSDLNSCKVEMERIAN